MEIARLSLLPRLYLYKRENAQGGENVSDIFVKLHKKEVEEGIVSALGIELYGTLSVMSLYMDERGRCFPSQDLLAELLGVRRETVNRRIKALCEFRWKGEPILVKEKSKHSTKMTYLNNVYYISRNSGLKFGKEFTKPCDVEDVSHVRYM